MMANQRIQALIWDAGSLKTAPNEGSSLSEFIMELHTMVRLGLSGSSLDELGQVLGHRWEIAPAIDRLILLSGTGESPEPEDFAQAADTLQALPGETVWVGALPTHVENARAAGLQAVLYQSPAQVGNDLLEMLIA